MPSLPPSIHLRTRSHSGVMVLLQSGIVHILGLLDLAVAYSSPPVAINR